MSRYLTGINSTSFDMGYDPATGIFDKSKVQEMDDSNRIYFIKNPIGIFYNGGALIFKRKTAIRLSKELSLKHGGEPLILECNPNPEELEVFCPSRRNYHIQNSPKTGVERIFLVESSCSFLNLELFSHLREISVDRYLEKYFRK